MSYPFQQQPVLKGVNIQISKGEKVLILGPSGGGKSTLALTLNGIIPKSIEAEMTGTIMVDGENPQELSFREISERLGILFQDPETQFCMLTVEDEILFGLENLRFSRMEMKARLEKSLDIVGLTNWRKAQIRELSGGMKQKLALACLLSMDPEVFILDEPTANLDPASTDEIFQLFIALSEKLNKTLIFIEHKLDYLLPYLERVIVLGQEGKVIADGAPRDIFNHRFPTLIEEGIWVPQICRYAKNMEKQGMKWRHFPLTIEEWKRELESEAGAFQVPQMQKKQVLSNNKTPLLQVENVSFSYQKQPVLQNISFSISNGDFVALLGSNGAGKSTLSKTLMKLLKPEKGEIYLDNKPLSRLKAYEHMQKVGFVFQNPEHQFICDTVEQELSYGFKIRGWRKEKWQPGLNELLAQFHLTAQRQNNPFSLSQGQKRRLSVATMLTNDQQLLILDEPTFGQDYANMKVIMNLLKELNQNGKTILMVTHDMELVSEYANKVILLHDREIAYQGDVISFFKKEELLHKASLKVPFSYSLQNLAKVGKEAAIL
ncbi:energy-coupling factor transport system ATP-binding protein [Cytobacillus purgationiresistens]|uniref:Energy-coupling factor transport system ATP-binding protein n=1 Tax=Cytobacillus purgationiresistens TaxID=863449 RepID=A0ABU0AE91_9BACI|nr:energy-coupling factor transport system ATP-binding protein [Cytobacillus purgationiresistens]